MRHIKLLLFASTVIFFTACGGGGGSSSGDKDNTTPDTTAPVITIIGLNPDTAILNVPYFDMGATAIDNIDGNTPVATTGTVDTSILGQYKIIYSATDNAGNNSNETRIVNVIDAPDTVPPVITLNGNKYTYLLQDDTYDEEGATAVDSIDGDVPVSITGTVDTSIPETYIVTYRAEDTSGNQATEQRTVLVEAVTTHHVSDTPELRQALLDAAQNGVHDKIILADGMYKTTDDGLGTFVFLDDEDYTLTLQGSSADDVILSGDNQNQVLNNNSSGFGPLILKKLSFVDGNSTGGYGGGGVYTKTKVTVLDCKFLNNYAGGNGDGGGLRALQADTIIHNSLFQNNTATLSGGGIRASGDITIKASRFTNNKAKYYYGGFEAFGDGIIENSIFEKNSNKQGNASFGIGGRFAYIANNLIIQNSGGIHLISDITNIVLNNIFEDNNNIDINGLSSAVVTVENNYINEANILISSFTKNNIFNNINLGFVDTGTGDYHLESTSDLIDAGTSKYEDITYVTVPTTDFDGNPRPVGASTDIGPYEYQ